MTKYLLTAPLALFGTPAHACAVVSPDSRAALASEQTIIVWDEARRTEHFIRRLQFHTGSSDSARSSIGFLVPTPNVPQLSEASGQAFERVQSWMKPRVVLKQINNYTYTLLPKLGGVADEAATGTASNATSSKGVQVLAQQKIGVMQATVLKGGARDVVRWLKRNGYPSRPSFVRWLQPYARRGWAVTAFKFARAKGEPGLETTTVRLSFRAQEPFYPYREPQRDRGPGEARRHMALYVLAPHKIAARAGGSEWNTTPEWSQSIRARPDLSSLLGELKLDSKVLGGAKSSPLWMTAYVDWQAKRPNADLQFVPASDHSPIEPEPIVQTTTREVYVPLDLAALCLVGLGGLRRARRRSAQAERVGRGVAST